MTQLEPHDLTAEQATLGAMLSSPAAVEQVRRVLVTADFYRPAHQLVFDAIINVMKTGVPPDPVILNDHLTQTGDISKVGGALYLHTLIASVPITASASVYADTVRRHAVTRRLRVAGKRILQWTDEPDADPGELTERILREVEDTRRAGAGGAGVTAQMITDFFDVDDDEDTYDWVIPGLMERGDRLILTGVEGAGKSELFRQTAVMAAAGIRLFSHAHVEPMRALLLDFENAERHTRRKLWPLIQLAAREGRPVDPDRLWVECRPQGIDLATDRGVSWLLQQVTAIKPDIVFLGPLYKLAPRALNDDSDAAPVLAALDMVRARGACVVLEAHAGHALGPGGRRDMRVRGSAAFMGWPEFAYGLRWSDDASKTERVMDFVAWRGDRDTGRAWPEKLTSAGLWPWSESL
jgi:hypothetical protein